MRARDIAGLIGKEVEVNGHGDLGIDPDARKFIGEKCTLVKQCKSGLLYVSRNGQSYPVPMRNVNPVVVV